MHAALACGKERWCWNPGVCAADWGSNRLRFECCAAAVLALAAAAAAAAASAAAAAAVNVCPFQQSGGGGREFGIMIYLSL